MCDQPGLQREESSHRGEESSNRGEESCCRGDGSLDAGEEPSVLLHKLKSTISGIRRKTVLNMPLLPSLDLSSEPSELTELVQTYKAEVTEAACQLICDWAQKILKRSFDTVVEIAHFLVQEHLVNPRCSQAELPHLSHPG
ncbi:hypothetical protein CRUP_004483, partial [Coryphaenoides rupestris]